MKLLISLIEAILMLTGAGCIEELDETELERFEAMADHPLCINLASGAKLHSCGLFSDYQVASLQDYISRTGDILSLTELGTVPGFTPELVRALALFISFESHSPPGARHRKRIRQDGMLRTVMRDEEAAFAGKYHMEYGERAELYLSAKERVTGSVSIYGKRPWKLVLGDFNARFGQGLLAWSGFSLSGFSTAESFCRNASGISGTGSFSPSARGLAAAYNARKWNVNAAVDTEGVVMASTGILGRNYTAEVNFRADDGDCALSADFKRAFGHVKLFGEAAFSNAPAVLAGAVWTPAYKVSASVLGRYYSPDYAASSAGAARAGSKVSDETGIAAGLRMRWLSVTADMALHPGRMTERRNNYQQFKSVLLASPEFKKGEWRFTPALRWVERMHLSPMEDSYSADWRHDLRCDLKASRNGLQGCMRLNAVKVSGERPGGLAYLECGYKTPADTARFQCSIFLRATACNTPSWNSRIYAYERDLPGSFSVPAWHGRKCGLMLVAGLTLRGRKTKHRLNLKVSGDVVKVQYQLQR